jgi:uncharacterized protein
MTIEEAQLEPYKSTLPYDRVQFKTYDNVILRGNWYTSKSVSGRAPVVIFVQGIGLLKEQYLENWFKHVLKAGYHVLTYDHRSFGSSDGTPRHTFNWLGQAEDFVDAVSYVVGRDDVKHDSVFCWGIAHGGGALGM